MAQKIVPSEAQEKTLEAHRRALLDRVKDNPAHELADVAVEGKYLVFRFAWKGEIDLSKEEIK